MRHAPHSSRASAAMPAPDRQPPADTGSRRRLTTAGVALLTAALLGACADGGEAPPSAEGTSVATSVAGASVDAPQAGVVSAPTTAIATAVPAPTQSESARMATEIAGRERPRYLRSIGNNDFGDGSFQLPSAIAMDSARLLYVLDTTGVQVFNEDGQFQRRFGDAAIAGAQSLAVSPDGSRVYVGVRPGPGTGGADGVAIVVLNPEGQVVSRIGEAGTDATQLSSPAAMAVDTAGALYVADSANQRIEVFAASGAHLRTIGEPGEGRGQFASPRALAFGPTGELFVGQGNDFLIQYFGADGSYVDTFGQGSSDETLFRVGGIAVGTDGRLYASRAANHYIQIFDADELLWIGEFGGLGRGPGEFNTPLDCMVSGDELYVVDQQNHRIQVFQLPAARE